MAPESGPPSGGKKSRRGLVVAGLAGCVILGAIVGMVVASFVVPPLLVWYNEPGAITPGRQTQMICNIPTLIHYTTQRLLLGHIQSGAGDPALAQGTN